MLFKQGMNLGTGQVVDFDAHVVECLCVLCGLTFELSRPWRQSPLADESNIVLGSCDQWALPRRVASSEGFGSTIWANPQAPKGRISAAGLRPSAVLLLRWRRRQSFPLSLW